MRKVLLATVAILLMASIGLSCTEVHELPVPEPEVRCTIIRDNYGVPHVFADTKEDLGFGAGYAMAQDRLWQADVLRRAAEGRLAELGLGTIQEDTQTRQLWYSLDELQQMFDDWNPGAGYEHLKPMIEAYVDGINAYITDAQSNWLLMPAEYIGQGLTAYLEPFTVADVVALTVLMGWQFGGTGGAEGDIYKALVALQTMDGPAVGAAIWDDIFTLNDPGAPVTIPKEGCLTAFSTGMSLPDLPDNLSGVLEDYEDFCASHDALLKSLAIPTKFGSNAIPISDELSATGNALEMGGPQMGYSIPQIVYDLGLHGAGINAQGMAFPATGPFILIGVSEYGAWTSTTGASDVMDLRILTLNPKKPLQYWHDGKWVNMEARTETIYGLKKQTSQDVTCYRSVYGPVISFDPAAGTAVSLQVPYYKNELAGEQGWQLFQEATNIDEFEKAVEMVWPNHNFIWADTEGNIGFWHAGRFPVKPEGADRRLPLKGDGTQEWVRVTDPWEMPRCINPTKGWLANWNNKPIANWPYAESDIHWGEGHRVKVLMDTLTYYQNVVGAVSFEDMKTFNQIAGYADINGMNFVKYVIGAAMASTDATVQAAGSYLQAWATATPLSTSRVDLVSPKWPTDPNPTYDHPGLTIFNAWYDKIFPEVFTGILPDDLIGQIEKYPSLLIRIFKGAPLNYNYLAGRSRDEVIVNALQDAIDDLTTQYGPDMSTWLTPVRMQEYDAQGALPAQYASHPYMNRGTYNQIAEMRADDLPRAVDVIPPGQSGFIGLPPVPSPHAYDQVALYASWTYKPMLFSQADVEAFEESRTVFYVE